MSLREDLASRLAKLQAQRAEIAQKHGRELAALDRQIAGTTQLLAKWDTFTVDEALAAVESAGLKLRVDG